jgi:hypothetical protein
MTLPNIRRGPVRRAVPLIPVTFPGSSSCLGGYRPPENMKEPDPPDDLEQTILETFDELHAEAKIVPMVFLFPPEVIECIKTYTKEHSLDPANLIPLAMKAITRFGWISLD